MPTYLSLIVPCLAAAAPSGVATAPPGALPEVHSDWRVFTTADGLPHNGVRALRVDEQRVWVGTDAGLALFDGSAWQCWRGPDGHTGPAVSAIDIDPRTTDVWAATWGSGLLRLSGGRIDRFDQLNSGLASNLLFDVAVCGSGVWAATSSGLSRFEPFSGDWLLRFERRAGAARNVITALRCTPEGLLAEAWCGPAFRLDPNSGAVRARRSFGVADVGDLGQAAVWRATPTALQRLADGDVDDFVRPPSPERAPLAPRCLAARSGGAVWIGTAHGLEILAERSTATWLTSQQCPSGAGSRITAWRDGRALDERLLPRGLPDDRIRCVAFAGERVWVGTAAGLALSTAQTAWRDLPRPAREPPPQAGGVSGPAPQDMSAPRGERPPEEAVLVGLLGPFSQAIALPGSTQAGSTSRRPDVAGAQLAVEHANARGGYRKQASFELLAGPTGYARYAWGTPEDDFGDYAANPRVVGIVGRLRPDPRAASAVALWSELAVVNDSPSPSTYEEAVNPWVFRCYGDALREHALALRLVLESSQVSRVALLRTPDSLRGTPLDFLAATLKRPDASGGRLVADVIWDGTAPALDRALHAVGLANAEALLTWCDGPAAVTIVERMRQIGMSQVFLGSERIVGSGFAERLGDGTGEILALSAGPAKEAPGFQRFAEQYAARFKRPASAEAYGTYLATAHLLQAIQAGGRDRGAARSALQDMEARACTHQIQRSSAAAGEDPPDRAETGERTARVACLKKGAWHYKTLLGP